MRILVEEIGGLQVDKEVPVGLHEECFRMPYVSPDALTPYIIPVWAPKPTKIVESCIHGTITGRILGTQKSVNAGLLEIPPHIILDVHNPETLKP